MREIRTSGSMRGEQGANGWHATTKARTGNPETELCRSRNNVPCSSTLQPHYGEKSMINRFFEPLLRDSSPLTGVQSDIFDSTTTFQ